MDTETLPPKVHRRPDGSLQYPRFKSEVSRSKDYRRFGIKELFRGATTADEVTALLLTAMKQLVNAADGTHRKWRRAAEERLAELRAQRIVTARQ